MLLLGMATSFLTSCQDGMNSDTETTEATLVWSGEYMVDGCGFEVLINDTRYKPENEDEIDASFKVEGQIPVMIEFERLGREIDIPCGLSPQSRAMEGIRVLSVKKRP
jgi:hypothetical protein